jgi:ABC-type protease/lipase transport system fused ATPase/permease subunit
MPLPTPLGRLAAEGVLYAHPGTSEPVLRGISFALEAGETLGIIGPSGSGKTTLARLLVGNLRPGAGHVRLDDAEVAVWDPNDRGRHVGYVAQSAELFAGTVRENIARMTDGPPDAVLEAARLAGIHDLVLRLPQGYETGIVNGGQNLSGGERQRIALARALYGNPCMVVLDEPNSSLDSSGEEALVETIERLRQRGITCVVISHRPSILRQVDRILVLRDGQAAGIGPRDEVLRRVMVPQPAPQAEVANG